MSLHMLKHAQPDAFACEVCGKTFKRLAYVCDIVLNIHLNQGRIYVFCSMLVSLFFSL